MKLTASFYENSDVLGVAHSLIGKNLITNIGGKITGGIITETEAYAGETDRASHAFSGRRTARTEVMYQKGGVCYIYLCYGVHYLFNVVTGKLNEPHAVLIRAIFPLTGQNTMADRLGKSTLNPSMTDGPGKLTKALGLNLLQNGLSLMGDQVWIEDSDIQIRKKDILFTERIGVGYAGEDAKLLYRVVLNKKK